MTPAALSRRWSTTHGLAPGSVIGFYSHSARGGEYKCFSNFYEQCRAPFDFVVPPEMCACALGERARVVQCDFSEKAIMLCKAAAMGDLRSYEAIRDAETPAAAKKLGRYVENWSDEVWDRI